jgi:hypothetical protein
MTKPKIFLSHSHADQVWVRSFAEALQGEGATVWLDEWDLRPEDLPLAPLERALRGSDIVAYVVTPEGVRLPNFWFELGAAVGMRKRFVPIISGDFDAAALPHSLQVRQFLRRTSPEETARRLLAEAAA